MADFRVVIECVYHPGKELNVEVSQGGRLPNDLIIFGVYPCELCEKGIWEESPDEPES